MLRRDVDRVCCRHPSTPERGASIPELIDRSALELLDGFHRGSFSPVDVVEALANRISRVEPLLKAFVTLTLDEALREAVAAERAYAAKGGVRTLEGVPLGVKDLFDTAGVRTTYGSPMFREHVPSADAEAVRRAKAAGAIVIGKTSTHEFAWGITSYNPHFDSGRNPWLPDRVSGGSSGGSAAALAAREVPLALGTDTGGSIRAPAAFCGLVGLKPTYGLVSAAGVFPLARSLDHVGPLARTPADAALLLAILADPDLIGRDMTPDRFLERIEAGIAGARIGVSTDLIRFELSDDVQRAYDSGMDVLRDLGAEIVEIAAPWADQILPAYGVIQRAEALDAHRRAGLFPTRRGEYGADVGGRLDAATEVSFADYLDAVATRERIRASFAFLFCEVDLLLTPISAGPPVVRGANETVHLGQTVPFRDFVMSYTAPQDLVGLPACAVRAGFDGLGIPIGLQFSGAPGNELGVLRAAHAFYAATPAIQELWPQLDAAEDRSDERSRA